MTLIVGIDEAGRGPVIGPMVMCGVAIEEQDEKKLKAMGAKDSKELSPLVRERLFPEIIEVAKAYKVIKVSPAEIDEAVESDEDNLNWLEARTTAKIINELKPDVAYVDCPSTNVQKYVEFLYKHIKVPVKVIAEHKADAKYPVVSGASIIAKVTRDEEIEKIKSLVKENFGSGYPSDPITQEFLKKNYKKFPQIFRKSWASWKNVAKGQNQKKLGEF